LTWWPRPGQSIVEQGGFERALPGAEALERAEVGAARIDTDGRTVSEAAGLIAAATGWPGPAAGLRG
jgi:hypothetical protein